MLYSSVEDCKAVTKVQEDATSAFGDWIVGFCGGRNRHPKLRIRGIDQILMIYGRSSSEA